MSSFLKLFRKDEDGYVLVLSLILLPVFLGFGLLIIDVGRGNNAHADLQAAADAVALAGARELDGSADAITRAHSAMTQLTNNVSMLGREGPDMEISLVYANLSGNAFTARFLTAIPGSEINGGTGTAPGDDTTPINQAFINTYGTTDPSLAQYVYVYAQSRNLQTAFFNPANLLPSSVPVAATAVAKSVSAVCDFTPLYICNPFENTAGYSGPGLQARFDAGDLHGRLLRLHPRGNGTHSPGNFGFLQVEGTNGNTTASAAALRAVFAGRRPGSCFNAGQVTTKPGGAHGIQAGINTKFAIFSGTFNNINNKPYTVRTSVNVRKGWIPTGSGPNANGCSGSDSDDHFLEPPTSPVTPVANWPWDGLNDALENVMGLPDNENMSIIYTTENGAAVPGAIVGWGDWPINTYLNRNYGITDWTTVTDLVNNFHSFDGLTGTASAASPGARMPSRYDVYRWEINNPNTILNAASGGGETGVPCNYANTFADPDPRLLYAAIIDCNDPASIAQGGGINTYNVNSYAEIFLTRPMGDPGNGANASNVTYYDPVQNVTVTTSDPTIDVEITRVTGAGGNGVLENFIRTESILVR